MEPENQPSAPAESPAEHTSPLNPPVEPVETMPTATPAPVEPVAEPAPTPMPAAAPMPTGMPQQAAPITVSFNQQSANGEFPEELRKWNWGAFLLSWIWGISNNTFIAFLVLVPIFNIYILIMLGMKGNEWAWKNRKFQSIEHFKKVQKAWTLWGVILFAISVIGMVALFTLGGHAANKANPQNDATRKANVDQIVKDLNAYGADSRNGEVLPYTLAGLGKTEPADPLSGFEYDYTPSESGATAEVCATLSDATKYCKTAEVAAPTSTDEATPTATPTP